MGGSHVFAQPVRDCVETPAITLLPQLSMAEDLSPRDVCGVTSKCDWENRACSCKLWQVVPCPETRLPPAAWVGGASGAGWGSMQLMRMDANRLTRDRRSNTRWTARTTATPISRDRIRLARCERVAWRTSGALRGDSWGSHRAERPHRGSRLAYGGEWMHFRRKVKQHGSRIDG